MVARQVPVFFVQNLSVLYTCPVSFLHRILVQTSPTALDVLPHVFPQPTHISPADFISVITTVEKPSITANLDQIPTNQYSWSPLITQFCKFPFLLVICSSYFMVVTDFYLVVYCLQKIITCFYLLWTSEPTLVIYGWMLSLPLNKKIKLNLEVRRRLAYDQKLSSGCPKTWTWSFWTNSIIFARYYLQPIGERTLCVIFLSSPVHIFSRFLKVVLLFNL